VIVWGIYFRDTTPREYPAVTPEEIKALPDFRGAGILEEHSGSVGPLTARMAPVIIVYFCSGWTLWLY